ncbi:MAG: NfeD family protein [Deferrisomatales bacterium]
MRRIVGALLLLLTAVSGWAATVPVVEIDGPIGPVMAEYVTDSLRKARRARAELVVLRIDTPGGLDASMRVIVQAVLASQIPVVAWVGPSGARAASAGLFAVAACHRAAMAPGTNLGAAHPVAIGGGQQGDTAARKAEEDAAAYLRSLAQQAGRDPEWFEQAVVESRSLSADEALARGVVDLVAPDLESLLRALDGQTVRVGSREVVLDTAGLEPEAVPLSARQKALSVLADPNVAYLLLLLGFYGLFFELSNPGAIFPGVLGGLCLILAFVGLQTLPFNYAGVLLILLGLLLLLLEVKIISYGLLTVGGVLCLTLGSLMLFKTTEAYQRLSLGVVVPAVGATVAFFAFAVGKGLAAQRAKPVSGLAGLVGERGRALDALAPGRTGKVFVHGEYWNARCDGEAAVGEAVEVWGVEGMELRVRPVPREEVAKP